jgi:hypothetical protein
LRYAFSEGVSRVHPGASGVCFAKSVLSVGTKALEAKGTLTRQQSFPPERTPWDSIAESTVRRKAPPMRQKCHTIIALWIAHVPTDAFISK